ncbi:hypothetical protein PR048_006713 [Dryococelus australis]|uniref:Uncharacterized protein n=1 Tax=Dryococelus australis TaxID=614101 RepID=A0ABQ9IBS2_9NEOP|nr:hypothetical protein PR048_006713 [Dryococelus australis]
MAPHILNKDVFDAEIMWTFRTVDVHASYKSNENISKIFLKMFSDSDIALKFSCGEKKSAYLVVFGIAPYLQNEIVEQLSVLKKNYVLLFYESLTEMRQIKQLDIHISSRYGKEVKAKNFTSIFLGHSIAKDILNGLLDAVAQLKLFLALQLSMDDTNVNWKVYRLLQDHLRQEHNKTVLNIGSSSLHVAHNVFKTGCSATSWDIHEFLGCLYTLFKEAPARREDYQSTTGSIVRKHVLHDLILLKLKVFISVAKLLQPFLTAYHVLSEDHRKILVCVLQRFVKADALKSANSSVQKLV